MTSGHTLKVIRTHIFWSQLNINLLSFVIFNKYINIHIRRRLIPVISIVIKIIDNLILGYYVYVHQGIIEEKRGHLPTLSWFLASPLGNFIYL